MTFTIDESTEFGARAAKHLREAQIAWMTTVTPSGAPLPSPVWFLWDGGDEVIMLSKPGSPRVPNVGTNPKVALNFNSDRTGGDVVVLSGTATVGPAFTEEEWSTYVQKYAGGLAGLSMTPEAFVAEYSTPVRVALTKVRGF